jgi:hypothetical protein
MLRMMPAQAPMVVEVCVRERGFEHYESMDLGLRNQWDRERSLSHDATVLQKVTKFSSRVLGNVNIPKQR